MKQGREATNPETDRLEQLLRDALPPVGNQSPAHNLWPAMRSRLDERPAATPWFDWALAGGIALFAMFVPASIPVFLYYL